MTLVYDFLHVLWCAAFAITTTPYVVRPTPVIAQPLRNVAMAGGELLVVTFDSHDHAVFRELTTVGGEPLQVRIPLTPRSTWTADPSSAALVVNGSKWWYVTLDDNGSAATTTFVRSDGSRQTYVRLAPPANDTTNSSGWQTIAVPGETPRAVELMFHDDETIVREVNWSGATRSWQLPPVDREHLSRMIAEPLPDGRIALLSNHDGVMLYLLAAGGAFESVPLRNVRVQELGAAIDSAGRIAIVAGRNAIRGNVSDTGTIDAAVIDPSHARDVQWRTLAHDVRVTARYRNIQVVETPAGFAAAWINSVHDNAVEATSIDAQDRGGAIVTVGQAARRGNASFFDMQANGDGVLFWWDDGERLYQRRLPSSIATACVPDSR